MERKSKPTTIARFAAIIILISVVSSCSTRHTQWYLWTSHRDERDGLHLAVSPDGINWETVKNDRSVFTPERFILRDPCIARDPAGTYHLLWTTAWNASEIKAVGYSRSQDLIHWEKERYIPVMENEPETENVWAPELFFDERNNDWIITWSSTVRGKFTSTSHIYGDKLNGRIYYRRTGDFKKFTPSALLFDVNVIAIDQTIYRQNDSSFYVFFKADRDTSSSGAGKSIERGIMYVRGSSPVGPFTAGPGMINRYYENDEDGLIEGPTLMEAGKDILMYYGAGEYCGAFRTSDMKTWERITGQMKVPPRYMHGTVIAISEKEARRLLEL